MPTRDIATNRLAAMSADLPLRALALFAVLFVAFFAMAALNVVALVFYGRVDARKLFHWRDVFDAKAAGLTALGAAARRCVVIGIAGAGAMAVGCAIAALVVVGR